MSYNLPLANRYRETAIKTANPLQLIVILYDGAIQSLQEAREHIKRKDIGNRARCVNRCVAIITELQACLNFNASGNIAASLDRLYNYMKQGLFKASLEQRTEPIDQVIALLENLRSAWGELANQSNIQSSGPMNTAASAPAMIKNLPAASSHPGALNICG
jgi:flagellar protein FliS